MSVETSAFIVSFQTAAAAMQWAAAAERNGIPGRIIPVPRALETGCGMAWFSPAGEAKHVLKLLEREKIPFGKAAEMKYKSRWNREKCN